MAKTIEDIYEILSRIEASGGGIGGGGRGSTATSSFSKSISGEKFTIDDFFEKRRKYNEAINGKEEKSRKELKDEIAKSDERILELEEKMLETIRERQELLEKQELEGLTEDEAKQLEKLTETLNEYNKELGKSVNLHKELNSTPTGFEKTVGVIGKVTNGIKTIYDEIKNLSEPWSRLDSAASKYARSIGMAGDAYKKFRDTSLRNIDKNELSASSGLKPEEILNAQLNFVKATGRNIGIDDKTQADVAHMSKLLGDGGLTLAASLDKFGLGMADVAEFTTEMFNDSVKSGISFEELTQNVSKNLNIAQNYTFKNGIKGLESMAKKSLAIKMDMQQIANLAEKVSTVEGAVQTSAKLQVLGGPFAQLADPMGMLNEGLNDMEGLFDRVSNMVGGLGSFNKESGEVEVSSYNKRRIRAAAEAMGMDYGQLMESVNTQARRNEIGKQLASSASLSGLDEETKELIKNTASFKNGKAGITTANGEFKALEGLSGADAEALKEELKLQTQTKEQDIKSIVQSTKGAQETLEGFQAQMDARQAKMFDFLGENFKKFNGWLSQMPAILSAIIAIKAMNSVGSIADALSGGKGKGSRRVGEILENIGGNKAGGSGNSIGDALSDAYDITDLFGKKKGKFNAYKRLARMKTKRGYANAISKGGKFFKGIGKFGKNGLSKLGGKVALKGGAKAAGVLGKLGKAAAAGGGVASVATVAGAIGNIATDALVEKGKIKKGGGAHHAMSAGSSALAGAGLGAMIGSVFPGIGTAIGAAVGGVIGAGVGLIKSGAVKQMFKKVKNSKFGKAVSKKASELKESFEKSKVGKAVNTFRKSKVGKAIGKVIEYGTPTGLMIKAVKAITDKNKLAKSSKPRTKSIDILNQYTAKVKPVMETGVANAAGEVAKANKDIHVKTDPHDIKLNGTLNIKGENGQTIDLMSELKNNPRLMRQLTEMISNEMGVLGKGGYVAQGV